MRACLRGPARMCQAVKIDENLYIEANTFVQVDFAKPCIFCACRGDFKSACSSQASTAGNVQAFDHRLIDALSITASRWG